MARNEHAFRLRNALRLSLPAFKRVVPLDAIRAELEPTRLAALQARYDLATWARCCSRAEWREGLYALDLLDAYLPAGLPTGRALDVGSKNGVHLPGLATAWRHGWDAVELDAHRRYLWGSTRRAYGEAIARAFPGCRYVAGDVRSLDGPWALVTWMLPFVTRGPLLAWGLPEREFAPAELLRHVTERILPGGALLVVNQGEREAEAQAALFAELGLTATALGPLQVPLSPYRAARHGFLWRREG